MFTGIVEQLGTVKDIMLQPHGGATLAIAGSLAVQGAKRGDSIAVSGVCLTVVDQPAEGVFVVDVMPETLHRTALGTLTAGSRVNLERALPVDGRLHGHIVQGHVDGVGQLSRRVDSDGWIELRVEAPEALTGFIAEKGAVALNGVSLTVTTVVGHEFGVALIPETLRMTNLGLLDAGDPVNIEIDVVARYVAQLLEKGSLPAKIS